MRFASKSSDDPQVLASHVTQRLSGIGQSKVSEDCMNRGRHLERTASNKQQQPAERLWAHLIDSDIVSGLYQYEEPQWRDRVAPAGDIAKLPKPTFSVALRQSPKWIGDIIGTSRKPSWFTTSAVFSNVVFSDNFLMQQALATDNWVNIRQGCFLAEIAGGHGLALRRAGGVDWFMSLGHQHSTVVIAWPCVPAFSGTKITSMAIDMGASPQFLLVCDLGWEAVAVRWRSLAAVVASKRLTPHAASTTPRIFGMVDTAPRPLLEEAAMNAFWSLSGAQLKAICKYMGIAITKEQTDVDRLWQLMHTIFPKMPATEIMSILELRGRKQAHMHDFLMCEEAGGSADIPEGVGQETGKCEAARR